MCPRWLTGWRLFRARRKIFGDFGAANFLYADGDILFAHADRRRFDVDGTFGELRPPGLCIGDACDMARGMEIKWPVTNKAGLLVASVPLTSEGWSPIAEGTVIALRDGQEIARSTALRSKRARLRRRYS